MKKIILSVLIIFNTALLATGGSIYSRYGLGEFHYNFSARRFGMGGFGFALSDKDFLSNTNPAGWNQMQVTRFDAGIMLDQIGASTVSDKVFNSNTYFNGVMFGFPVDRQLGISFTMGIIPYTNVNYNLQSEVTDDLVGKYTLKYQGEGGISKLFVGASYRLPFDLSLGLTLDYLNGGINHLTSSTFASDSEIHNSGFTQQINYNGIGFTAGLISNDFSSLLGIDAIKDLRIGIIYSPKVTLDADSVSIFDSLNGITTSDTISISSKLPGRFGIGLAFKLSDRYQFILDYMSQPLSQLEMGNAKYDYLQDISKYSLGFEYRPDARNQSFWQQIMYRCGVSYENTPYKLNGKSLDQFSIYAGTSFPLGYQSTLDIGFQYGRRGTTDNKLVKEDLYKLFVTLSLGELWFISTER